MRSFFLLLASCTLSATAPSCINSAQEPLAYEAFAVSRGGATTVVDGWTVTLTRADIALGPFYFCAAASGSATLCKSSVAELTHVRRIDALSPNPVALGTVHGFTGNVQSASYDFGMTWFTTQSEPTAAPESIDGHSVRLEGHAEKNGQRFSFVANVDVVPQYQGQTAIPTAPALADVTSSDTQLEVVLEPRGWIRHIHFDTLWAKAKPHDRTPWQIDPGSTEHSALLVGLKNLAPPEFRWSTIAKEL
jgi:hypothetical protein